jgi:hypothetical protein
MILDHTLQMQITQIFLGILLILFAVLIYVEYGSIKNAIEENQEEKNRGRKKTVRF